jgi:hypothetical protein
VLPGYLLSLLVRQRALLKERFETRYPHAWLVWEPGERLRPESQAEAEAGSTRLPTEKGQYPVGNDALCFPLPEPSKPGNVLTVGRHSESSIVIDDMSISRVHAVLGVKNGAWYIQLSKDASVAMFVRNMSLQPGEPVALVNGCTISAGSVTLTFYERKYFAARMEAEEKRLGQTSS